MPIDTEKLLRDALAAVEQSKAKDELEERFKRLEERRPELRMSDVMAALEGASDEELDALQGTVLGGRAAAVLDDRDDDDNDDDPPATPPKPKPRTRPGRKSGSAYDWDVDKDGEVVPVGMARVYSGDDEPEEVELRDAEQDTDA